MSHLARTDPESLLVHGPRLRALARELVGDAHLAEDLVQETWSRALENPPPAGRPLLGWLTAVLRNLAFQGKRMGARRTAREREAARAGASEPAAVVFERFELHRELVESIRGLREPYRQAILLRYFDGLPPRRIAQRLGLPPKTVKTRLHRGLALLRAELDRRYGRRSDWFAAMAALLPRSAWPWPATLHTAMGIVAMNTYAKIAAVALVAVGVYLVLPDREGEAVSAVSPSVEPSRETAELVPPQREERRELVESVQGAPAESVVPAEVSAASPTTCVLGGIVRNVGGDPVPEAWVFLCDPDRWEFGSASAFYFNFLVGFDPDGNVRRGPGWTATTSDDEGRYGFLDVEQAERWAIGALHLEHGATFSLGVPIRREESPVHRDVQLEDCVVLFGRVTDEVGEPIPNARLILSGRMRKEDPYGMVAQEGRRTDEDGAFRFHPLPFRLLVVFVEAEGFEPERSQMLEVSPGEPRRRVDFGLERSESLDPLDGRLVAPGGGSAWLQRKLTDRLGGPEAFEDVRRDVLLLASASAPGAALPTGSDRMGEGRVDFENDLYTITPWRSGARFLSVWLDDLLLGAAVIEATGIGPDIVLDLDGLDLESKAPSLERAALVVRAVDDGDGTPLPSFRVRVNEDPTGAFPARHDLENETGAESVRLDELRLGQYRVSVEADGYVPAWRPVELASPAQEEHVEFRLTPGRAEILGAVQDAAGEPLNDVDVFLYRPDGEAALPSPHHAAKTNVEGTFEFLGLLEGDYVVVACIPFGSELAPSTRTVTARPKAEGVLLTLRPGIEVTLEPDWGDAGPPANPPSTAAFRILDASGIPLLDHARPGHGVVAGFGGHTFVLPPGRYVAEVLLSADGFKIPPEWTAVPRVPFDATPNATIPIPVAAEDW